MKLRLSSGVSFLLLAACSSSAPESPVQQESALISDASSILQDGAGTFTVTCKDGSVERHVTAEQIAAQHICESGSSDPSCLQDAASWYHDHVSSDWSWDATQASSFCADGGRPDCLSSTAGWYHDHVSSDWSYDAQQAVTACKDQVDATCLPSAAGWYHDHVSSDWSWDATQASSFCADGGRPDCLSSTAGWYHDHVSSDWSYDAQQAVTACAHH